MPFIPPSIKPSTILRFLYAEIPPSIKNSNKLVSNLNAIIDIKNIIVSEKIIIMVAFIDIYCDIKKDRST